jgi:phenylalanyl-tRNA synthetase beta chain
MKISYNWLKKYINLSLTPDQMEQLLTGCGLEVEAFEEIESVKGGLRGLVVGEVLEKEKHPDADRLSITKVNVGKSQSLQIVCGATNVAKGQKVLVATEGARLYPTFGEPFDIKNSKIRGQVSEGMICSEDEVGLGASHDGIMVLDAAAIAGTPAAEYFKVEEDVIFEIGLTPNRVDAASHLGVARDLAAVINTRAAFEKDFFHSPVQVVMPPVSEMQVANRKNPVTVTVENSNDCPRYCGVSISGLKVQDSPAWIKNALLSIGVKPVNNIVDVTNYVMFETGQPLHAFDAMKVRGKILVKRLNKETTFVTLDGIERKLTGEELMICNEYDPMCIAGVFGGIQSGVSNATTDIFLESAYFNPTVIRKGAKLHALKTESSFRFERGTDPACTVFALKRAVQLIQEIAGGNVVSDIIDIYPKPIEPVQTEINYDAVRKLSGLEITNTTIDGILQYCGMTILDKSDSKILISVPTYKTDVTRQADVVEEILRTYGYHHIPVNEKFGMAISTHQADIKPSLQKKISHYLTANGFYEIINNSLTSLALAQKYTPEISPVKILNPLSNELDILRTDLLFSMLGTMQYNSNRKQHNLKLFEFGKTYQQVEGKNKESDKLALAITGNLHETDWHKQDREANLFYLKSIVQDTLAQVAPVPSDFLKWVASDNPAFSTFATFQNRQNAIGYIGKLKKSMLRQYDINHPVYYAEIDVNMLLKRSSQYNLRIKPAPRFPEVKRDLSMLLDDKVQYADMKDLALKQEKKLLRDVSIFDVYQGDKIEAGKKSYALSFLLRDDEATLTDKQIDVIMQKIESAFEKNLGAIIRK